ncbi:tRNA pseudouridine(55) synthase TruB [Candidatus Amarolinea dominans]|uniref:tRNA pseudouridine(55) synthase TruB n=1 Tax=Candidatus Amarolinea dominans TaxID=3140696 RepID=UPI0031CC82AA
MIFGLLNIHKPTGRSSRWVVNAVSRITGVDKIGHAGTLDPLATGVLLMALGPATRLIAYLQAGTKVYQAAIHLGVSTSTYDAEGEVLATAPVPDLAPGDLQHALARFVGDIEQHPPAYSALKVAGVAAYRKARRGQTVELPSRRVQIEQIELLSWHSPVLTISVTCAPGTYIRSLAFDLGQALGCGAHISGLVRTASGHFRLEDSVGLETLAAAAGAGDWQRFLLPPDQAVLDLTPVYLDEGRTQVLRHGNPVTAPTPPLLSSGRAYDPDGRLIALVTYDAKLQVWQPDRVFDAVG